MINEKYFWKILLKQVFHVYSNTTLFGSAIINKTFSILHKFWKEKLEKKHLKGFGFDYFAKVFFWIKSSFIIIHYSAGEDKPE